MKLKQLLLAIFLLGTSLYLSAYPKAQFIPIPKKLVFDPVKINLSRFNFATVNSKNKIISYPVISEKEKSTFNSINAPESEAKESVITITIEDGKLTSHPQPNCAETHNVQPDDYFFLKAEDADVEFTKDENGSINLIIKQKAVIPGNK